jgi:hypothetical protein
MGVPKVDEGANKKGEKTRMQIRIKKNASKWPTNKFKKPEERSEKGMTDLGEMSALYLQPSAIPIRAKAQERAKPHSAPTSRTASLSSTASSGPQGRLAGASPAETDPSLLLQLASQRLCRQDSRQPQGRGGGHGMMHP